MRPCRGDSVSGGDFDVFGILLKDVERSDVAGDVSASEGEGGEIAEASFAIDGDGGCLRAHVDEHASEPLLVGRQYQMSGGEGRHDKTLYPDSEFVGNRAGKVSFQLRATCYEVVGGLNEIAYRALGEWVSAFPTLKMRGRYR